MSKFGILSLAVISLSSSYAYAQNQQQRPLNRPSVNTGRAAAQRTPAANTNIPRVQAPSPRTPAVQLHRQNVTRQGIPQAQTSNALPSRRVEQRQAAVQQPYSPQAQRQQPQRQQPQQQQFQRQEVRARNSVLENRQDLNRQLMNHMHDNREVRENIWREQNDFKNKQFRNMQNRGRYFAQLPANCQSHYSHYWQFGFRGGFVHGFHPIPDPSFYFWNPLWAILYRKQINQYYFNLWAQTNVVVVPVFQYTEVYYPTEETLQVIVSASALPAQTQVYLLEGMSRLAEILSQTIADRTGRPISLNANDIVINDSQFIQDDAVVIQGFINHANVYPGGNSVQFGFKAFIDLRDPALLTSLGRAAAFVPAYFNAAPRVDEIQVLQQMNSVIVALGGTIN